ncbi:MAG: TfoX/Sxy family protein [Lysobacteraceae bacterium]
MSDKEFIAWLHELLDPLGRVTTRAMFGAHGLYLDGIIIGLVDEGRLYLKTDADSQPQFTDAGCKPFVYMSKYGPIAMSYWTAPDDAMDSSEAMAPWARLALAAALRKDAVRAARKKKSAVTAKPAKNPNGASATKPARKRKPG